MGIVPWDSLNDYIYDWMKGLQEIVDSIAPDPDADNSMLPLAELPYRFDATLYGTESTNELTDGYSTGDKGYGYQPWLYAYRLTLYNNSLRIVNTQYVGKNGLSAPDWWQSLTDEDISDIESKTGVITDMSIVNDYPAEKINIKYSNYGNVWFEPAFHSASDIRKKIPIKNGQFVYSNGVTVQFDLSVLPYEDDGFYRPNGIAPLDYTQQQASRNTQCIIVLDSDSDASRLVNDVLATGSSHNDVINYNKAGSEYKLYYGDTYLVYALDDSKIYNYQDLFNGTKDATDAISGWFPTDPPVITPTYDDVKYGPEPPEPEPITDDDYVDMGLGVETDGMAMYNMAVITRDDLIQLITDFEANADTGLSFIPHVLGLYKLGIESSQLLTTELQPIILHKEPNGTSAFTSADSYNIVKDQLQVIDCGSITIDREELLTNTFYDYSPYSTYEMFIPGCGWITLPDTVVGRTISVSIVFDLTTCSCKGVVRSEGQLLGGSGTTIATVNGIIGSSVPLSINETGLQRAAIFNGSTQAAMALGTAFLGVGIGNPYMGASGVAMAAGALADNHVAGNTTYTNTKGGATDYSVFGDGYKAVLKITRPVVEIPDNYGHTVGFVVNEYGLLGDFHGFTVCVNPHIHISATSDEKEEIKRLLESGVILPNGEE